MLNDFIEREGGWEKEREKKRQEHQRKRETSIGCLPYVPN